MQNTIGPIDTKLLDIPVKALPANTFTVFVMMTPKGNLKNYYLLINEFCYSIRYKQEFICLALSHYSFGLTK